MRLCTFCPSQETAKNTIGPTCNFCVECFENQRIAPVVMIHLDNINRLIQALRLQRAGVFE